MHGIPTDLTQSELQQQLDRYYEDLKGEYKPE